MRAGGAGLKVGLLPADEMNVSILPTRDGRPARSRAGRFTCHDRDGLRSGELDARALYPALSRCASLDYSHVVTVQALETANESETESVGAKLARSLCRGDVVLVKGEVGSGKTTFVRGAARALGVEGPVTSPTFSIAHRYEGAGVTVCHLDLYRLADLDAEDPGLLADHTGQEVIAFIEWPEAGERELHEASTVVTLRHAGENRRVIEVCGWR